MSVFFLMTITNDASVVVAPARQQIVNPLVASAGFMMTRG